MLPKETYQRILEDVVVAVNMLHYVYKESKGIKGMDPEKNYNMVYDKKKGIVFVEFWYGAKSYAKATSAIERFTVAEVCGSAADVTGGAFETFKKKEVII